MSFTPPPSSPPTPPVAPSRDDTDELFDEHANAMVAWYSVAIAWFTTFVGWTTTFIAELLLTITKVEGDKNAAQAAAAAAATSAQNAAVISGAARWVAGNYSKGDPVWSPISLLTYRRIPEGPSASSIDPANDPANWRLTGSPYSLPQKEITTQFLMDPITGLPSGSHILSVGVHYIILHPLADCKMPSDAVAQELLRVTNRSGAVTPVLRRNGGLFDNEADDLQLDSLTADKTFTMTTSRGWL